MPRTNGIVSVLDGQFEVGDLVWQQMYSPTHPRFWATLEERIAGGVLYGKRRLMRVAGVYEPDPGMPPATVKWWLVDPEHPTAQAHMSWVDDNWCVLEHAQTDGMLF